MKGILNLVKFLWNLLVIGIVVNVGVWLAVKGVSMIWKSFGRLNRKEI